MSISNDEAKQKVDDLVDVSYKITNAWANNFISDMQDMNKFSERQLDKIAELWEKYCGNS